MMLNRACEVHFVDCALLAAVESLLLAPPTPSHPRRKRDRIVRPTGRGG